MHRFFGQVVTTLDGHADDIIGLPLSDCRDCEQKLAELATTWKRFPYDVHQRTWQRWNLHGTGDFMTFHQLITDDSMTSTAGIDYAAHGSNAPEFGRLGEAFPKIVS